MNQEVRRIWLDEDLQIKAYQLTGIAQAFPNHFHEEYVVGFIEKGRRGMVCQGEEYITEAGDIILFNPRDNHGCWQIDGQTLDFRSLNIPCEVMEELVLELTGEKRRPRFKGPILYRSDLVLSLKELHQMIAEGEKDFKKEELLLLLVSQLLEDQKSSEIKASEKEWIEKVCSFIEERYFQTISLGDLSNIAGVSKYHLIRSFTKEKGISPYSYLETIRIDQAKKLLSQGISAIEVAIRTGFSDQSHFSKFFKKFIGLTPKQYSEIFIERKSKNELQK